MGALSYGCYVLEACVTVNHELPTAALALPSGIFNRLAMQWRSGFRHCRGKTKDCSCQLSLSARIIALYGSLGPIRFRNVRDMYIAGLELDCARGIVRIPSG